MMSIGINGTNAIPIKNQLLLKKYRINANPDTNIIFNKFLDAWIFPNFCMQVLENNRQLTPIIGKNGISKTEDIIIFHTGMEIFSFISNWAPYKKKIVAKPAIC